MEELTKERLRKLDKINVVWLFEQISLGNLMRGIYCITQTIEPVKKSLVLMAHKFKQGFEAAGQKATQPKKRIRKSVSLG